MEKFQFITHLKHDPFFNLASEEYLLKQKDGCYIYLWINAPAVIIGVNQNAIEEVNLGYAEENGIKVVRRLTGGGAVYHDLNNICYTVIAPYNSDENTFQKFSSPVIEYLRSLGLNAEFSGRNDILVDGKKVSGVAETVHKNRIMHHGTLMFDTDTSILTKVLTPNKLKIESKGIKSVRSRVTNIREYLKNTSIEEFFTGLKKVFLKDALPYEFSEQDLNSINALVNEKYSSYLWNIGRSPKGKNKFEAKFSFGVLKINFNTESGFMKDVGISGDFFCLKPIEELENKLNGSEFSRAGVLNALNGVESIILGANATEIADKMFG